MEKKLLKAMDIIVGDKTMKVTITIEGNKIRGAIYGGRQLVKFLWFDGKESPSVSKTDIDMNIIEKFINARMTA